MFGASDLIEAISYQGVTCQISPAKKDKYQTRHIPNGECVGYTAKLVGVGNLTEHNQRQVFGDIWHLMQTYGFQTYKMKQDVGDLHVVFLRIHAFEACDKAWRTCMGVLRETRGYLRQEEKSVQAMALFAKYQPYWRDVSGQSNSNGIYAIGQLQDACQRTREVIAWVRVWTRPEPEEQDAWLAFDEWLALFTG